MLTTRRMDRNIVKLMRATRMGSAAMMLVLGALATQSLNAIPVKLADNFGSGFRQYFEDGNDSDKYDFSSSLNDLNKLQYSLGSFSSANGNFAGAAALYNNYADKLNYLNRGDGSAFNVYSLDISELFRTGKGGTVTFTGYLAGGGKVTQTVKPHGIF